MFFYFVALINFSKNNVFFYRPPSLDFEIFVI